MTPGRNRNHSLWRDYYASISSSPFKQHPWNLNVYGVVCPPWPNFFFLLYGFDGQLFEKGKINESDFVLIDQALKPRPCRPLLLSQLLAKVNS